MKVSIEFELDSGNRRVVDVWLEKITRPIRASRYLVPGSWKIRIEDS